MRRAALVVLAFVALACVSPACDHTQADEGNEALLRVANAQFFHEAAPADTSGPRVTSVTVGPTPHVGSVDRECVGEGDPPTTAFAFSVAGDVGYWIIPAGLPSTGGIGSPTFDAQLSFASAISAGPHELVVRAVDAQRRFGPATVKALTLTARTVPAGQLVVDLSWTNGANLDLHVVDPNGIEIWKRNINSYQAGPPGSSPVAPGTPHDGGILDFDSDASCVTDGLYEENVIWSDPPPKGHYVVRVDTFSLCGEPAAPWQVQALVNGVRIGAAQGIGTAIDTTFDHDRGAGVLALEFDVP